MADSARVYRRLRLPTPAGAISGAVLCFALGYLAIGRGWQLPVADHPTRRAADDRVERDTIGSSSRTK